MTATATTNPFLTIDPRDLAYAVQRLAHAGKTSEQEVRDLAADRTKQIETLKTQLAALEAASAVSTEGNGARPPTPRTSPVVLRVAKQPAADSSTDRRRLGGLYGGLIKGLPKAAQKKAAQIRASQGFEAAIGWLRTARGAAAPKVTAVTKRVRAKAPAPTKTKRVVQQSPQALASRRKQVEYIRLRQKLTTEQKEQASKLAQAKGVGEALKFIKGLRPKTRVPTKRAA